MKTFNLFSETRPMSFDSICRRLFICDSSCTSLYFTLSRGYRLHLSLDGSSVHVELLRFTDSGFSKTCSIDFITTSDVAFSHYNTIRLYKSSISPNSRFVHAVNYFISIINSYITSHVF